MLRHRLPTLVEQAQPASCLDDGVLSGARMTMIKVDEDGHPIGVLFAGTTREVPDVPAMPSGAELAAFDALGDAVPLDSGVPVHLEHVRAGLHLGDDGRRARRPRGAGAARGRQGAGHLESVEHVLGLSQWQMGGRGSLFMLIMTVVRIARAVDRCAPRRRRLHVLACTVRTNRWCLPRPMSGDGEKTGNWP